MRNILIAIAVFIFIPNVVFASSDDIFGFWISETALPSTGKKEVLIIKHDSFQEGKQPPIECKFQKNDDNTVIDFTGPFGVNLKYIVTLKDKKLFLDFPTATDNRSQQSYIRINEEKAQLYLK